MSKPLGIFVHDLLLRSTFAITRIYPWLSNDEDNFIRDINVRTYRVLRRVCALGESPKGSQAEGSGIRVRAAAWVGGTREAGSENHFSTANPTDF